MKKLLFSILLTAIAFSLGACTDGKPIGFDQLPQNAQTTIKNYFNKEEVLLVTIDKDNLLTEYEVKLKDSTKLEFDRNGNLIKIDSQQKKVPDGLIPEKALAYVNANYPDAFITEWGKDDLRWKAELNNGLELVFNNNGEFLRYDD